MSEAITITLGVPFTVVGTAITNTPEAAVRMALEEERDDLRCRLDRMTVRCNKAESDLFSLKTAADEIRVLRADLLAATNELANEKYKAGWRHDHLLKYLDEHRPES